MQSGFLTLAILFSALTVRAQDTVSFYGVLAVGGQEIPLNVAISGTGATASGTLQSPKQSSLRLPIDELSLSPDSLAFELLKLGIAFRGARTGDSISGIFTQGGFTAPLTLYERPTESYASLIITKPRKPRPQDPTDFPYRRLPVHINNPTIGVDLAGELTLPPVDKPHAAMVLVSGSGPQDRNQDLGPDIDHRLFLVLSDYLTRQGYAVLRYDDRGVGESGGTFDSASSADFAEDAAAAVDYLAVHEATSEVPVGIIGHSEGGMVGPMVATLTENLDFLVLLAAPGVPIRDLMLEQRRALAGETPPDEPVFRAAYDYLIAHPGLDSTALGRGLRDTILDALPALDEEVRASIVDPENFATTLANGMLSPWMRYFLRFDPARYLQQVSVPVLAINGALDRQVDVGNLTAIERALEDAGNEDVTTLALPGINHLMQPATSGLPAEYGEIETTVDPGVVEAITDWLAERFK